jgi:hypothetical protein
VAILGCLCATLSGHESPRLDRSIINAMTAKGVAYLIVFSVLQVAGVLSLGVNSVHSNPVLWCVGFFFLLPGGILFQLLTLPWVTLVFLVVGVNLVTWWSLKKWVQKEWWPAK